MCKINPTVNAKLVPLKAHYAISKNLQWHQLELLSIEHEEVLIKTIKSTIPPLPRFKRLNTRKLHLTVLEEV